VPTDTAFRQSAAVRFAIGGVALSLAFFGVLRLNWTEVHAVLPFTRAQAAVAVGLFGTSALPVEVTLACSGADALAICLGAILAYPVEWRRRVAGAAGGAGLILGLNTLRIGSLGRVAALPVWFNALHVYVWPGVLTLAIAGYVFGWMRLASRPRGETDRPVESSSRNGLPLTPRFVFFTAAFLICFTAASPFFLESTAVLALARFIAGAAALTLGSMGVSAHAAANVLWTPRGGFLVTQECISTPLIPVYLAAVFAYSATWRRVILGVAATLPLFVALGVMRLLVVALPDALVASPLFLVHAFYQLLLGAVVVFVAALWRHGGRAAFGYALAGILAGFLFVFLLGPFYTRVVTYQTGTPLNDPQGAIALLPAFQVGLYLALCVAAFAAAGWRRVLAGFALLELSQTAGVLVVHALASHTNLTMQVRDIRGWAIAAPVLIFMAVVHVARPHH
jgi:exosortase/archaeosortase family protein